MRLVRRIEHEIPRVDEFETEWRRYTWRSAGYSILFDMTRDRTYLWRASRELEACLDAYPDDQEAVVACLLPLARIEPDPEAAVRYYENLAAHLGWWRRQSMYYKPVMLLESFYPGTLTASQMAGFFSAWETDLDSLREAVGAGGQPQEAWNKWASFYHLWRADVEVVRGGDMTSANAWLQEAGRIRAQSTASELNLYVDARLELRLGDIAWARGDTTTAELHFRNAQAELADTERHWSQKGVEDYAGSGLKELNRLGYEILSRLEREATAAVQRH